MKPEVLKKGDKVAIISLSNGLLGMPFCKHELDIGLKRLEQFGLVPVIMNNSLKDMDYLKEHPMDRAADLKQAFMDPSIKAIITAIGGDDTYKTIPYLMEDEEFKNAVRNNPKIFIGFSDTTNNHIMLNKLGLNTYYGPCFLVDLAELDNEMLPYTKYYFEKLFMEEDCFEIKSSDIWYTDRTNFGEEEIGKPRKQNKETHGFEVLNGKGKVTGKLFGGCIESFYDAYVGERYGNENEIYEKYNLLPTIDEWKEKVLFLETSQEMIEPNKFEKILMLLKDKKVLESVKGVIFGKPYDEKYYDEYKEKIIKVFNDLNTPVLYNVNFGHAYPRCILPYNILSTIDYDNKKITIDEPMLNYSKQKHL